MIVLIRLAQQFSALLIIASPSLSINDVDLIWSICNEEVFIWNFRVHLSVTVHSGYAVYSLQYSTVRTYVETAGKRYSFWYRIKIARLNWIEFEFRNIHVFLFLCFISWSVSHFLSEQCTVNACELSIWETLSQLYSISWRLPVGQNILKTTVNGRSIDRGG